MTKAPRPSEATDASGPPRVVHAKREGRPAEATPTWDDEGGRPVNPDPTRGPWTGEATDPPLTGKFYIRCVQGGGARVALHRDDGVSAVAECPAELVPEWNRRSSEATHANIGAGGGDEQGNTCGDRNVDDTTCILVRDHAGNHYDGIGYWAGHRPAQHAIGEAVQPRGETLREKGARLQTERAVEPPPVDMHSVECRDCGAFVGRPCTDRSGATLYVVHAKRRTRAVALLNRTWKRSSDPLHTVKGVALSARHIERFWSLVDKRGPDECWLWTGTFSRGKTRFSFGDVGTTARRIGWLLKSGRFPTRNEHVEVTCGQIKCVNPAHLVCPTREERFWAMVEKTDGCWLWKGATSRRGYGVLGTWSEKPGSVVLASHFMWMLQTGAWPTPGLFVCHHCDNPPCVRPDHLFIGTPKDNHDDMVRKGRHPTIRTVREERSGS